MGVIVGDSDGGQIGKQSDKDDELGSDSFVDDDHGSDQINFQVQAQSDTVLDIGLHTLENLPGDFDGIDNSAETGGKENNIGSGLGSFSSAFDGNTTIRLFERWSIVNTTGSN